MKSITGLLVICPLLLSILAFSAADVPCKVYSNDTVVNSMCLIPGYPIAPIIEFLNQSRTDDVSLKFQQMYKSITEKMDGVYAMLPKFLRTPECLATINNFACASLMRQCDTAKIPDLSHGVPPQGFDLDPEDLGLAPCEDQCQEIIDACVGAITKKIPGFGNAITNFVNNKLCSDISSNLQMDVANPKQKGQMKKSKMFAPAPNCTRV